MSILSDRLNEQDLDALARVLHAVRQRRVAREAAEAEGAREVTEPAGKNSRRRASAS
jgi:hypothetical protein